MDTTSTTTTTSTAAAITIDHHTETNPAHTLLSNRVALRQQVLDITAKTLKTELFGLDTLIDRLIDSVRAWYLLPEVIDRPVIVCLWGLTGTGKTQLVRRLAQLLGFYDRFLEVQMDGFSNSTHGATRDSIASMLANSSVLEGAPGILLLDEFQRFRTRDRKGNDVAVKRYQDVWALLSDGRLSPPMDALDRIELEQAYHQYETMQAQVDKANDEADEDGDAADRPRKKPKQKSPFHLSAFDARDLQHALKLSEPITQIMRWTPEQVQERLEHFRNDPSRWGTDHSKLLILVTGNLDEMYQGVAKRVQDCDTDADVFHRFTERLSTIDVKEALAERFRPEQVARLGNQHLVFPSLNRHAYERLVADACSKQVEAVRGALDLNIALTPAVLSTLYQNAVFPVQGTRPVFSTVHAVLGPSLGSAAVWAMQQLALAGMANQRSQCALQLDMSGDGKQLVMRLQRDSGASVIAERCIALHLEIDKLRQRAQPDFRALLAVHEAGHGLVYALLNRCAPTDVRINVASFEGGYASYAPRVAESRRMARDEICVTLAGRAAELWVFGEDAVTTGAEEDLSSATRHAARYHRHWAMGDRLSRTDVTHDVEQHVNTDVERSNPAIEATLQAELARAQQLLEDARKPFERLVQALLDNGFVDAKQFAAVTGLDLPARNDALEPWSAAWQRFAANDRRAA
ncbi:AAA family ATPase [Diaphorobacter sp. HDW4A]|uniref:AAA family ATPase n=1 Tax=Diaphorobacter sp. HDW4A TaxID=2714924 RepID=UPI00140CC3D4|nr:AAA family ATPase [Diaphorobacter sp. HDW4A]QIL81043.1 AAA family ATPase [Diaphorobacter sp. HDW4A]